MKPLKEAFINKHNLNKVGVRTSNQVYCFALADWELEERLLEDEHYELFSMDDWRVIFVDTDKVKELTKILMRMKRGWWIGIVSNAKNRDEAKKILSKSTGVDLNNYIEKIAGPSLI